jgi:AraC-like DNA-binding protein
MKNGQITLKNKLNHGTLFKISRFKEAIKKTRPHTHDGYFELMIIREGEGFHQIESENYPICAPEIYFLKPGQLHCWQFTATPKGFVLLFKETFFDTVSEGPILNLLKNLNQTTRITIPADYHPMFLFEEMLKEYQDPTPYSIHIIHGHLRSVFSKILQLSDIQEEKKNNGSLHDNFLNLLPVKCPELHKVIQYAALLNTSPQNLNAACRKYTSKSAGEHISDQLILQAKRYILHTNMNMNEIADALRFNDASYFIKYFKKLEGITPFQFRAFHFQ